MRRGGGLFLHLIRGWTLGRKQYIDAPTARVLTILIDFVPHLGGDSPRGLPMITGFQLWTVSKYNNYSRNSDCGTGTITTPHVSSSHVFWQGNVPKMSQMWQTHQFFGSSGAVKAIMRCQGHAVERNHWQVGSLAKVPDRYRYQNLSMSGGFSSAF